MTKARDLANLITAGNPLADGAISVAEISDLTASAIELNKMDGLTASTAELNNVVGTTSALQTQLDNISVTSGSLTKSFASGETASITLAQAISPAPVVSATKEVAQAGISSKGAWDVNATASNYELHNTAYATTLTPAGTLDITAGSYSSTSFASNAQSGSDGGIFFKPDGTKLYILEGTNNDSVREYDLSSPFDISTASYRSIGSIHNFSKSLWFSNDGLKVFSQYAYFGNFQAYQYDLSVAWDISTISGSFTASLDISGTLGNSPGGILFSGDGTRLYTFNYGSENVSQYNLTTAFDLSTATYNSAHTIDNVSNIIGAPSFSSDGSVLYAADDGTQELLAYSLSTPYEISTLSSTPTTGFSYASEMTYCHTAYLDETRNKAILYNNQDRTLYEYDVNVPALVLGTGSFASTDVGKRIQGNGGDVTLTSTAGAYSTTGGSAFTDSSTIASGSWTMRGLKSAGDADGIGMNNLTSNGFSVSSASYDNVSFSVQSQEDTPNDITFNNDGTKMYVIGQQVPGVTQYSLSTAFDISTATSPVSWLSPVSGQLYPHGLTFDSTGTKLYITGALDSYVHLFTLNTAFDITSIASGWESFDAPQTDDPRSIRLNPDDDLMFLVGDNTNSVHTYSIASPFNASSYSQGFDVSNETTTPNGIAFSADGTKMFVVDTLDRVFQYNLSSPFAVSTASYSSISVDVSGQSQSAMGIAFSTTGNKMYILDRSGGAVYQYTTQEITAPTSQYHIGVTNSGGQIATNFWTDINSMTADQAAGDGTVHYAVSTDDRTTWSVAKASDGVRPIVRDNAGTWQYNTAVDVNNFDLLNPTDTGNSFNASSQESAMHGVYVKPDGTKMYLVSTGDNRVFQYSMTTAYDLSTASYDSKFFDFGQNDYHDVVISDDGTKLYALRKATGNNLIYRYNLSTAWDVSTASFVSPAFSVNSEDTFPMSIHVSSDGTKFFMGGGATKTVYQYTASTAYDLSTLSYDSVSLDVSGDGPSGVNISTIVFSDDGLELFVGFTNSATFLKYTLSTAFDLSTASYSNNSFDYSAFNVSETKGAVVKAGNLYMVGGNNNTAIIKQYSVSNEAYTTSATWTNATTNDEFYALQQALGASSSNRMDKTQLDAVADGSHFTLGDTLDLAIALRQDTASASTPKSDGVSINYDAQALNQGAVLGTDYDYDFPDSTTVRVTSNAAQNLKVRVV